MSEPCCNLLLLCKVNNNHLERDETSERMSKERIWFCAHSGPEAHSKARSTHSK